MAPDDDPETSAEAARTVAQVADRAEAAAADRAEAAHDRPAPPPGRLSPATRATLAEARHHLDAAWHTSDAGTDVPADARLRQVKRAVLAGMRPVTSHQVPFNQELVVAVDRLAQVVEDVARRMDGVEEAGDATLRRVQAGIATVDVQVEDLDQELRAALARVDELSTTLRRLVDEHSDTRHGLADVRSRQDVVLRAAREAIGTSPAGRSPVGRAGGAEDGEGGEGQLASTLVAGSEAALLRRLAAVGRPDPAEVTAWAESLADRVAEAAAAAPVIDLDPDRGEWLDVWRDHGLEVRGAESDPARHAALEARGHRVALADPIEHLGSVAAGSLGAVTAAVLADVRPLADLVALVDAAREALRPGGLLVLAAADPTGRPADPAGRSTDDPQWADPRRRPLDPRVLTVLALERGFVEADVAPLGATTRAYALVARTAGAAGAPG